MLLRITHETRYDYAPAVGTAQHILHLQPRDTLRQHVVQHQLQITPEPRACILGRNTRVMLM